MVKIFSNFDSKFDDVAFEKAKKEFGADNVCFVRRDRIYIVFKIMIPVFLRLISAMLLLGFVYGTEFGSLLGSAFEIFIWICIGITGIMLAWVMTNKLIDYYMDFTIITQKRITSYDQTGIFTRAERALDISKIKSVRVMKKGILHSMFNYGSIVFFSEGDDKHGDITLNYITDPNKLSKKLGDILKLNEATVE